MRISFAEACRMRLDDVTAGLILCRESDRVQAAHDRKRKRGGAGG